jgi:hypothetical protein
MDHVDAAPRGGGPAPAPDPEGAPGPPGVARRWRARGRRPAGTGAAR